MTNTPARRLVLALGYTRQVGKDRIATVLHDIDPHFQRFSFADALRRELDPFLLACYGISAFTTDPIQKEFIRPYLITHGMARRATDPDYWVKRTMEDVRGAMEADPHMVPVVVDARFVNEVRILRAELGALIIHVTRDGAPEPTDEEQKHYPALIPLADFHFRWGRDTLGGQRVHVERLLAWAEAEMEQRYGLVA